MMSDKLVDFWSRALKFDMEPLAFATSCNPLLERLILLYSNMMRLVAMHCSPLRASCITIMKQALEEAVCNGKDLCICNC